MKKLLLIALLIAPVSANASQFQDYGLVWDSYNTVANPVYLDMPAGRWMKITTTNTVGSPSFAIRAAQQEVLF